MEQKHSYIYKITSPTGRIYIGQTLDFKKRMTMHRSLAKRGAHGHLYQSVAKYGWAAHKVEIIAEGDFTKNELNQLEIDYIKQFDSFRKGMNMTLGGDGIWGFKVSDERKQKHRERMMGENNPFYGRKHTNEVIEKLRIYSTGRTLSAEARKKVGEAAKGNQYALSYTHKPNARQKMSEASKGNKHALGFIQPQEVKDKRAKKQQQKVYSSFADMTFDSIKHCAEYFGLDDSTVAAMFRETGKCKIKNRFGLVKIIEPKIRCTETGKEYYSTREAAKVLGIREGLLSNYLNGKRYNRTSLKYIQEVA